MYIADPSQVYKGTYSIRECAHGCGRKLELGPRLKAAWAWCAVCQAPTCKKPICMNRCPKWHRGLERWDQSQFKDWVADQIQADPDAKQQVVIP